MVYDITVWKLQNEREREHLLELFYAARLATMSEMATEIAHEINQPLAAITNYTSACLLAMQAGQAGQAGQTGQPPILRWLESINGQARRASEIVRRLRSFVGKGRHKHARVEMNELIQEAVDFTAVEARADGIRVEITGSDTPCWVIADRGLIEQVILNLLRNAIEALTGTTGTERRIGIRIEHEGDRIAVAIHDNGPGIPPELGERIFTAFVTSKPEGLGMGLAISRSIIEAGGGQLWSASIPGGGATFNFTLPAAEGGRT